MCTLDGGKPGRFVLGGQWGAKWVGSKDVVEERGYSGMQRYMEMGHGWGGGGGR